MKKNKMTKQQRLDSYAFLLRLYRDLKESDSTAEKQVIEDSMKGYLLCIEHLFLDGREFIDRINKEDKKIAVGVC